MLLEVEVLCHAPRVADALAGHICNILQHDWPPGAGPFQHAAQWIANPVERSRGKFWTRFRLLAYWSTAGGSTC